jgi:hypothetical protein
MPRAKRSAPAKPAYRRSLRVAGAAKQSKRQRRQSGLSQQTVDEKEEPEQQQLGRGRLVEQVELSDAQVEESLAALVTDRMTTPPRPVAAHSSSSSSSTPTPLISYTNREQQLLFDRLLSLPPSPSAGEVTRQPHIVRAREYIRRTSAALDMSSGSDSFMAPYPQRLNRSGVATIPWCILPPVREEGNVYPFNSQQAAAKRVAAQVRAGAAVDMGEFASESIAAGEVGDGAVTITIAPNATLTFDTNNSANPSPKKVPLSASHPLVFVGCFNRYIEAMGEVYPTQTLPLYRYLMILVSLAAGHAWSSILAYDAAHRRQVAASGEPIDIIDLALRTVYLQPAALCNPCVRCLQGTLSCVCRSTVPKQVKRSDQFVGGGRGSLPMSEQVCWDYNRERGCTRKDCTRKHVCRICQSGNHNAVTCSNGAKSSTKNQKKD